MKYKIVLLADEAIAPTVIEIIRKSKVSLVSMTPACQEEAATVAASRYAGGKRDKGVSAQDFALSMLKSSGRKMSPEEMVRAFVDKGFSENSVSPTLSRLFTDKKVQREGHRGTFLYWV